MPDNVKEFPPRTPEAVKVIIADLWDKAQKNELTGIVVVIEQPHGITNTVYHGESRVTTLGNLELAKHMILNGMLRNTP